MRFLLVGAFVLLLGACAESSKVESINRSNSFPVVMVVLGDSSAYGTGASSPSRGFVRRVYDALASGKARSRYVNFARPGATTVDVLREQLPSLNHVREPNLILVAVCANDVLADMSAQTFRLSYDRLLAAIRDIAPRAALVVTTVPNIGRSPLVPAFTRPAATALAQVTSAQITAVAARHHANVANITDLDGRGARSLLSADGLHPSDKGYALIARTVIPAVRNALAGSRVYPASAVRSAGSSSVLR